MNPAWEPEFEDWSEDKVSMSNCELATNSMSRGEYGVIMQIGTIILQCCCRPYH